MLQVKEDEETRKVQFTGGSTYIISLPKRWIAENQVKKGSFIRLREEQGGFLTIVPPCLFLQKKQEDAIIIVSAEDDTQMITRKMVSAYLAGYNSIHIRAEKLALSTKMRHEIKNFVRRMLVGTEIVTDTNSQLVLQVLLSHPELTIQSALRRMSIITSSMHSDAMIGLKTRDGIVAKEVISTDNEVDRFNLYVTRLLKTAIQNPRIAKEIGLSGGSDCLGYRLITKSVERTADHAVNIAENVLALKQQISKEIEEKVEAMSCTATKMFTTSMESLFRQDYNLAETIIASITEISELEKEAVAYAQTEIENAPNLRLIIESIRRTAEYACDISEIVLNLNVDSILV